MKKVMLVGSISLLVVLLGAIVIFWKIPGEEKIKEEQGVPEQSSTQVSKEDNHMQTAEECINLFAKVIYTYDTNERNFYEGAEKYMTKEAYEILRPLPVPDEEELIKSMTSELQEITCYYREMDSNELESIVEVWYTLSGTGEFRVRNLIKLNLIYGEGDWKISEFNLLETLEE